MCGVLRPKTRKNKLPQASFKAAANVGLWLARALIMTSDWFARFVRILSAERFQGVGWYNVSGGQRQCVNGPSFIVVFAFNFSHVDECH